MDTIKKLWSDFGQSMCTAFVVATLLDKSVATGLFFALASVVALFIGSKMYESFKK